MRIGNIVVALVLVMAAIAAWGQAFDPNNHSPDICLTGNNLIATDCIVSSVIPAYNDASANWKKAGLQTVGGISAINATRVNCTSGQAGLTMPLAPSGLTPPAANDDAVRINQAITNCPTNSIVQLGNGVFNIDVTEFIAVNKAVTLRGGACAGSTPHAYCSTQIVRINGLLPYSPGLSPGQCGTSPSTMNSCSTAPLIYVNAQGPNVGRWSACNFPMNVAMGDCSASVYATVAADALQGATTVRVDKTSIFSVGMQVYINELTSALFQTDPVTGRAGGQVWAAPDTFSTSGSPASGRIAFLYFNPICCNGATSSTNAEGESSLYSYFYGRMTGEIHQISAIGAGPCPGVNCTITFDSPIMAAQRQSGGHDAKIFIPTDVSATYVPMLQFAGVENMSIGRGDISNLTFYLCAYCWAQNIDSWGWTNGAVEVQSSLRVEINTVYGYDCFSSTNAGNEYAFDVEGGGSEVLLVNSIFRTSGKNMTMRGGGSGSVVAYNYMDDVWYDSWSGIGSYWIDLSANSTHFPGAHHVLFEGNQTVNMDGDSTHGSGSDYITFYRNWGMGLRTPFTDPEGNPVNDFTGVGLSCPSGPASCTNAGAPGAARAAGPGSYNYWYAYVGNVLGTTVNNVIGGTPYTTVANGWVYASPAGGSPPMYASGTPTGTNGYDTNLFMGSPLFILRDGNYDYVNAAVVWANGVHALPNSLYLNSAPSFFAGASCTYPWPWVTSTSGTLIQSNSCGHSALPAQARFAAGTPFVQP